MSIFNFFKKNSHQARLKEYFEKRPEVAFAFLFGSRSKGLERNASDFDIAIYLDLENRRRIEFEEARIYPVADRIWQDLERILEREVDLVVLNSAPAHLAAEVITKGKLIIVRNKMLFLRFMLIITSLAADYRQFAKDYFEIFQRSKSLSEEDKTALRKVLVFLENEIKDAAKFRALNWVEYQTESDKRRSVERWAETIVNATIDVAKILLSSEKINIPETYREAILKLELLKFLPKENLEKLASWTKLRNILAHEYLDVRWEQLNEFIDNSEPLIVDFINEAKKLVS